jgi:hypothetical protein
MPGIKTRSNLPWGWLIALGSLGAAAAYWPAEFLFTPVVSDPGQVEASRAPSPPQPLVPDAVSRDAATASSADTTPATVVTPVQAPAEAVATPEVPTRAERRKLSAEALEAIPVADTVPSDGTVDPNEPMDTKVADIFKWDNPRISARDLKRYLVRAKQKGSLQRSLKMVERWISDHPDRATFLVMMHFQEKRTSTRLKRWARQQMATLYDAR